MNANPVWMYRNGEGKLFPSPESVPADEGWSDAPTSKKPEKKKRVVKVETDEEKADDGDGS